MTEIRKGTNEGVPFVVVTPDELHPINQEMRRQVQESCDVHNERAKARREKIRRGE